MLQIYSCSLGEKFKKSPYLTRGGPRTSRGWSPCVSHRKNDSRISCFISEGYKLVFILFYCFIIFIFILFIIIYYYLFLLLLYHIHLTLAFLLFPISCVFNEFLRNFSESSVILTSDKTDETRNDTSNRHNFVQHLQ
jgi:hypothetical protein